MGETEGQQPPRGAELTEFVTGMSAATPVAVKLSPFRTSPVHFGCRLDKAGAAGLIPFNRPSIACSVRGSGPAKRARPEGLVR